MLRFASLASGLLAFLALAPVARADGAADAAAAATLFREARALMEHGSYALACDKFEAASKLIPTPGTLLSLADCREKNGQGATAYGVFLEAGMLARQKNDEERDAEAKRRAALLEPMLARVALDMARENRGLGVTVKRDGIEIPEAGWDTPFPVDPGAHTIEASRVGAATWSTTITIAARPGVTRVHVPALVGAAAPAPFWNGQRIAGVTMGAVGLVAIGVGSAFTAVMVNKNSASMPFCPSDPTKCYAPGVSLRDQAFDASYIATATLVPGAILAGGGLIVFLTAPKTRTTVVPIVGPSVAGVALEGAW